MKRKATQKDLEDFVYFGLARPELLARFKEGRPGDLFEYEESSIKDPVEFTALYLNGKRVAYWPGY